MNLTLLKKENNLILKEAFLGYMKTDKGCGEKTIIAYDSDLRHFIQFFKNQDLLSLTEDDMRKYKTHLVHKKLAPTSVYRHFSSIRSFYEFFVYSDKYDIFKNPCLTIQKMKVPKKKPLIISESQADTLLNCILLTGSYGIRDYAIFSTFIFTGVRVSELINIKLADVDFDQSYLMIRNGKGGKDRYIPMVPRLSTAIQMYLENGTQYHKKEIQLKRSVKTVNKINKYKCGRSYFVKDPDEQALFLTKEGTSYSEKGIDYLFKVYTKRINIYREGLSLHALRRSCLTFLYKQDVDLFLLKEISGHAQIQTLEHYLTIDNAKVVTAMAKHPLSHRGIDTNLLNLVRKS